VLLYGSTFFNLVNSFLQKPLEKKGKCGSNLKMQKGITGPEKSKYYPYPSVHGSFLLAQKKRHCFRFAA